jgi:hypothetical protein
MKGNNMSLEPPDPKRCQADVPGNGPLTMGGEIGDPRNVYRVRCKNKPRWIATEKKPGPDGQVGSMSLCDECAAVMEKQMPGHASFALISHTTEEVTAVKVANCNDCPFRYVDSYDDSENMCSMIPHKKTGPRSFESYVLKGDLNTTVDAQCPLKRHSVTMMLVSDTVDCHK